MTKFNKEYWQAHYEELGEKTIHLMPSPHLVSAVSGLGSGRALDAGCGKGIEAIWLAKNGWKVTAVDIAEAVLNEAKNTAELLKVDVNFEQADITTWSPEADYFDLVISQYVHTVDDQKFIKKLSKSVKTGGTLLIVGHQPPKAHETTHHAHGSHITAEIIATYLNTDEWEIKVAEPRTSERVKPNGEKITLNDSVFVAKKLA